MREGCEDGLGAGERCAMVFLAFFFRISDNMIDDLRFIISLNWRCEVQRLVVNHFPPLTTPGEGGWLPFGVRGKDCTPKKVFTFYVVYQRV